MKYFYIFSLFLMVMRVSAGTRIIEDDDGNKYSQGTYLYIRPTFHSTAFPRKVRRFDQDELATSLFGSELPESTELDNAITFHSQETVQNLLDKGADPFKLNHTHRLSSCKKEIANFALVEKAQRNYCKVLLLCLKKEFPKMPKEIRESLLEEYVQENNEQIRALMHPDDYPFLNYQHESTPDITIPFSLLYPVPIDDID